MAIGFMNSIQWTVFLLSVVALVAGKVGFIEKDASGTILDISGQPYYAPLNPILTVHPSKSSGVGRPPAGFIPVTSIRAPYSPITKSFLEAQIRTYANIDDVWTDRFLESLFISYDGQTTGFLDEAAEKWLQSSNISHVYLTSNIRLPSIVSPPISQITAGPPAGPYFTTPSESSGLNIHNMYRLRKDEYASFLFGAIPNPSGGDGWIQTNITLDESGAQYIPVPSRVALLTKSLPLSGTRFALKDIFDAKGLPTGAGSLAYARVYPAPYATAPAIERLLDLGATIIGKTRTSQFAHGAQPWEFEDIPYSWNPRADGHLTASASSSGSACAIAGYDWLEFTVGSDTRGSVRKPAAFVGAYGIRPSHGSLDLTGVLPLSEEMDTAGFFARDPRLFAALGARWYEESPVRIKRQTIRFPKMLFYPTEHFPVENPAAQALYDGFVTALEKHLKITMVPMNFTTALLEHLPNGDFNNFQKQSNLLAEYRSWISVGQPLIEAHEKLFNATPTFDPRPRRMFALGATYTEDEFVEAVRLRHAFRDSVNANLLKADIKSCSESLFMYDAGTGGRPSYRVEEFNHIEGAVQAILTGHTEDATPSDYFHFVATMAGLPEITIPLGQVRYYSHISREWEMLPVTVQLVAHRGCDEMLLKLTDKLAVAGTSHDVCPPQLSTIHPKAQSPLQGLRLPFTYRPTATEDLAFRALKEHNEPLDRGVQLLPAFDLCRDILGLQKAVEGWDDVAVNMV
ncbi:hypothetical protein H0H87_010730 [Tephrocybe sp. NHM501043]|nr:hypothetical protein H0H87_010730 [Tephrocybe sp. NHM501043]